MGAGRVSGLGPAQWSDPCLKTTRQNVPHGSCHLSDSVRPTYEQKFPQHWLKRHKTPLFTGVGSADSLNFAPGASFLK